MKKAAALIFICICAFWLRHIAPERGLLEGVGYGSLVVDSQDRLLRMGLAPDSRYRIKARLEEIDPEAVRALLEYEDRYFYSHPGVNPFSLFRAALSLAGGRRIGGSTITMQVARLAYNLRTSCISGKLKQIWYALVIEARYNKSEILEAYFNLAPYGGNIEGIEAASWIYFRKPASMLTLSEARALAIVPQNPNGRNPAIGVKFAEGRRRLAEGSLPLAVIPARNLPFSAPHLTGELIRENPGKRIATTLDGELQRVLERTLANYTRRGRQFGICNASAMLVRWTDMHVLALAGSADFFSDEISGQIDGTNARRSPGSALKPFIYALALDAGLIHPQSILADTRKSFGGYDPENFERNFRGPISAAEALRASRNLPAIQLAGLLPGAGLYGFLKAANVKLERDEEYYGLSLALGGAELTMRELAALYAMLANQGLLRDLNFLRVEKPRSGLSLLSPEAAWLTLDMLKRPEAVVRSAGENVNLYYKTGTSNGMRDAWTCGIAGEYVLVVWIGNFDNSANPNFIGVKAALPLFEEIAHLLAARNLLREKLEKPKPGLKLARANFCIATGDIDSGHCDSVGEGWFIAGKSSLRDTQILRKILVDESSGMRTCIQAGRPYHEEWWEFWPSDILNAFASVGIYKQEPPQLLPECAGAPRAGKAPRIQLPKKNVVYQRRDADGHFRLPLQAASDLDAGKISWYAGKTYLGASRPGEIIFWEAPAGRKIITAVDSNGRSARQECVIEVLH